MRLRGYDLNVQRVMIMIIHYEMSPSSATSFALLIICRNFNKVVSCRVVVLVKVHVVVLW